MVSKPRMFTIMLSGAAFLSLLAFPSPAPAGILNLNKATTAELLDSCLDINRVLITRLVDYRNEHGPFRSVEDLLNVKGMNSALVLRLGVYKDQHGDMVVDIPDEDTPEGMTVPLY